MNLNKFYRLVAEWLTELEKLSGRFLRKPGAFPTASALRIPTFCEGGVFVFSSLPLEIL